MKQRWIIGLILTALGMVGCTTLTSPAAMPQPPIVLATEGQTEGDQTTSGERVAEAAAPMPTFTPTPTEVPMSTETPLPTATPTNTPEPTPIPLPGREVFQFRPGEVSWNIMDDRVMGGVSQGRAAIVGEGEERRGNALFFSGSMSLANNGGFSSVRSEWQPQDLSGTDGVLLRVRGDGKAYRLRIRSVPTGPSVTYDALFQTNGTGWQTIYIPYSSMIPNYRGYRVDVPSLDPATIGSFGFMLSDKQPGDFALAVDWVRAASGAEIETYQSQQDG